MKPVVIVGPTAVGKSGLGMALAQALGGEIVNADALQVYRGLDIGTAKPSSAERQEIRHHLVDILDPHEPYSAGEFERRARAACDEIRGRGRRPIVVGGSGLYVRALRQGLSPMPDVPTALRGWTKGLTRGADGSGRRYLAVLDPEADARLPAGDTQRRQRALEIVLASGRPQAWWARQKPMGHRPFEGVVIGLTVPRAILYDRIAGRVCEMLESGWVGEVERLLEAGVEDDSPAFQAIGYRELARFVRGALSLSEATDQIVRSTRRFARRQLTWFSREPDVRWLDGEQPSVASEAIDLIRSAGD